MTYHKLAARGNHLFAIVLPIHLHSSISFIKFWMSFKLHIWSDLFWVDLVFELLCCCVLASKVTRGAARRKRVVALSVIWVVDDTMSPHDYTVVIATIGSGSRRIRLGGRSGTAPCAGCGQSFSAGSVTATCTVWRGCQIDTNISNRLTVKGFKTIRVNRGRSGRVFSTMVGL